MRARAAVAWKAGEPVEITEVEFDDPRPDEVLVGVEAVGICHGQLAAMDGRMPGVSLPMIFGHEGRVRSSGSVPR